MRVRNGHYVVRTWTNLGLLAPTRGRAVAERQLHLSARLVARLAGLRCRYLEERTAILRRWPVVQEQAGLRAKLGEARRTLKAARTGTGTIPEALRPLLGEVEALRDRLREITDEVARAYAEAQPELDAAYHAYLAQVNEAVTIERDAGLLGSTAETLVASYRRARELPEAPLRQLVLRYHGGAPVDRLEHGRVVRIRRHPPAGWNGRGRADRVWTLQWQVGRELVEWPLVVPRRGLRDTVLALGDDWRLKQIRVVVREPVPPPCPEATHEQCGHLVQWHWRLAVTAERRVDVPADGRRPWATGPVLLVNAHWFRDEPARAVSRRAAHEPKQAWHRLLGLCPVAVGVLRDGRLEAQEMVTLGGLDPALAATYYERTQGLEEVKAKRARIERTFVQAMVEAGVLPASALGDAEHRAWRRRTIERHVREWLRVATDDGERRAVEEAFRKWLRLDRHEWRVERGVAGRLARWRLEVVRLTIRRVFTQVRPAAVAVELLDLAALRERPPEERVERESGSRRQAAYQAQEAAPGQWIRAAESAAERAGLPVIYTRACRTLADMAADVAAGRVRVRWPGQRRPRVGEASELRHGGSEVGVAVHAQV
jgi:hypothetical protein